MASELTGMDSRLRGNDEESYYEHEDDNAKLTISSHFILEQKMSIQIEQTRNTPRSYNRKEVNYDIVVVGAGPAGFCAAIRAARSGMKTALVQDRSVIGGNHSTEIRVNISGAGHRTWGRFSEETGIVHEFLLRMAYKSHFSGNWNWNNANMCYSEMAEDEENLTLYMNTLADKVNLDNEGCVESVEGLQARSETRYIFKGKYFIDCTGDGTVSHLAGLGWRMGREKSSEFSEILAPEKDDRITMGATMNFRSRSCGQPVPYTPPKGAINFHNWKPENFPYLGKCWPRDKNGLFHLHWWAEVGGLIDQIKDEPEVSHHCRMVIYGLWDYIKNSGKFEDVEDQELEWISPVPGKRESRRIEGDVIVTETDYIKQNKFDDAIGHCGYFLDVHPVNGYLNRYLQPDQKEESKHIWQPGPGDIPLRALFNSKRKNLFFAGRNASCTHIALGTLRIAATCAVTGEAAASAAAFCIENDCTPAETAGEKIRELQKKMLRNDSSIIGRRIEDTDDLAQSTKIEASSVREVKQDDGNELVELDRVRGIVIPLASEKLESVKFWLETGKPAQVTLHAYGCDKIENYRLKHKLAEKTIEITKSGWTEFALDVDPGTGRKLFLLLQPCPGVKLRAKQTHFAGMIGVELEPGTKDVCFETKYTATKEMPDFEVSPVQNFYDAHNATDGHIRPYCLPHMWSSAEMGKDGEWLQASLSENKAIKRIELAFNSDLNHDHMEDTFVSPELTRSYRLDFYSKAKIVKTITEEENYLRYRVHEFEAIQAERVRLTITDTWGHQHAEVYALRIY